MNVPKKENGFVFVGKGEKKCSNFALKPRPENKIALQDFRLLFGLIEKKQLLITIVFKKKLKTIVFEYKTFCFPSLAEDEDKLFFYYEIVE